MRRVIVALLGAIAGTTLLVGLKAQGAARVSSVAAAQHGSATGAASLGRTGVTSTPDAGTPAAGPRATSPSTTTTPATTRPAKTMTTTAPPAQRTILGDPVATVWHGDDYGTTQVKIVVTGTHIDDIIAIKEGSRPKTTATTLRAQALAAQSADIGNVSGATASSNAYKQSLQSALAKI